MSDFVKEFKDFAMRGNVIDLAVGVVIGAAFGKIVSSMVNNIIMPPLGLVLGGIDFSNFFINLSKIPVNTLQEAQAANIPVIAYGLFLNTVIEFLIIAIAVFVVVKQVNRLIPKPKPKAAACLCPYCKQEIAEEATRCPYCTSELDKTA